MKRKTVKNAAAVATFPLCDNDQIFSKIVEPLNLQRHIADAGEITGPWCRKIRVGVAFGLCHQRTVNRHRLRCILNAAGSAQAAMASQGIGAASVAERFASDLAAVPATD